jgi:hypothetical protein
VPNTSNTLSGAAGVLGLVDNAKLVLKIDTLAETDDSSLFVWEGGV